MRRQRTIPNKRNNPSSTLFFMCLATLLGCGDHQTETAPVEIQPSVPAERLADLMEDSAPMSDPGEFESSGIVLEVHDAAITIENEKHPDGKVLAAASDVKVYDGANEVELSSIRPGDRVKTYSERRGNRADGWQTLLVRIDLLGGFSPHESSTAGNQAKDHDSDAVIDEPGYPTKLMGVFVEADATAVKTRPVGDEDTTPSGIAIDPSVVVRKAGTVGGTELLVKGDLLELTSERRGNRADGWMSIVTDISVIDQGQTSGH